MRTNSAIFYLFILILLAMKSDLYPQTEIKTGDKRFREFYEKLTAAESSQRQSLADYFIAGLGKRYPVFEDDTTVVFLYKGNRDTVEIVGDLADWSYAIPMIKIEGTNLWYYRGNYEPDARLDYWLQFSKNEFPLLDTLNEFTIDNGWGQISELAMPQYKRHPLHKGFIHGQKGDLSLVTEKILLPGILPYEHIIDIYLPPSYNEENKYPVVYFQDGRDYIELGLASYTIHELIKNGEIQPVIAVFVTPPNFHKAESPNRMTEYGMNDDYVKFFVNELVNYIDSNYSTERSADARLIIGDSYGGLISTYIPFKHPEIFKNAYSQSGYHSFSRDSLINLFRSSERKPLNLYIDIGTYEKNVGASFLPAGETNFTEGNRRLKQVLEEKGYDFIYHEYHEGHTWGNWRRHLIDALIYFFGKK
jgi:enterochelin esterase family protein